MYEDWCKKLHYAAMIGQSEKDDVFAIESAFHEAGKLVVHDWRSAQAMLQAFGRIHAWVKNGRNGHLELYQPEADQIIWLFVHGLPWEEYPYTDHAHDWL